MLTVTKINSDGYMRGHQYDQMLETKSHYNTDYAPFLVHNKPIIKGDDIIRYVSHEGIHIKFNVNIKDCKEIAERYKVLYGKSPSGYIQPPELISAILGKEDIYIGYVLDYAPSLDLVNVRDNFITEYECVVHTLDTFSQVKLSKRAKEKLAVQQKISDKASFHALVAKDVLVTRLNECGFDIAVFSNRYLKTTKIKGWNKLIKEALEYYLNNEVLKDIGCKVKVPKVKNQHKYNYNDILCDLGEVELDLQ